MGSLAVSSRQVTALRLATMSYLHPAGPCEGNAPRPGYRAWIGYGWQVQELNWKSEPGSLGRQ